MYSYLYFAHMGPSHKMKHYRHGVISRNQEKNCGAWNSYIRNKMSNVYYVYILKIYKFQDMISTTVQFEDIHMWVPQPYKMQQL